MFKNVENYRVVTSTRKLTFGIVMLAILLGLTIIGVIFAIVIVLVARKQFYTVEITYLDGHVRIEELTKSQLNRLSKVVNERSHGAAEFSEIRRSH